VFVGGARGLLVLTSRAPKALHLYVAGTVERPQLRIREL
jgi:hypothetical protein